MKAIPIPIKKHTKIRRPMSMWVTAILNKQFISNRGIAYPLVQDIRTNLENPLLLRELFQNIPYMMKQEFLTPQEFEDMTDSHKLWVDIYKKQTRGDWNETLSDMNESFPVDDVSGFQDGQDVIVKLPNGSGVVRATVLGSKPKSLLQKVKDWRKR